MQNLLQQELILPTFLLPGQAKAMQLEGAQAKMFEARSVPVLSLADAPISQGTLVVGDWPPEQLL